MQYIFKLVYYIIAVNGLTNQRHQSQQFSFYQLNNKRMHIKVVKIIQFQLTDHCYVNNTYRMNIFFKNIKYSFFF